MELKLEFRPMPQLFLDVCIAVMFLTKDHIATHLQFISKGV